jgi:MraZ protein
MFRGINAITVDAKGRFAVPVRYRDVLSQADEGAMVVTIDTEEMCLLLYPKRAWQKSLPSFNPAARRVQRLLIGHASDVDLDGSGRLLLPPVLREYAKLDKHVVMIGQGNKFEIWDETLWNTRRAAWLLDENDGEGGLPEEMKSFSL